MLTANSAHGEVGACNVTSGDEGDERIRITEPSSVHERRSQSSELKFLIYHSISLHTKLYETQGRGDVEGPECQYYCYAMHRIRWR